MIIDPQALHTFGQVATFHRTDPDGKVRTVAIGSLDRVTFTASRGTYEVATIDGELTLMRIA